MRTHTARNKNTGRDKHLDALETEPSHSAGPTAVKKNTEQKQASERIRDRIKSHHTVRDKNEAQNTGASNRAVVGVEPNPDTTHGTECCSPNLHIRPPKLQHNITQEEM